MEAFSIESVFRDGAWVITTRGEVRVEFKDRLVAEVDRCLAEHPADILLNFKHIQFLDSASTGALLQVDATAKAQGHVVVLFALSHVVARVLDVTRLNECFPIAEDEAGAREYLTER